MIQLRSRFIGGVLEIAEMLVRSFIAIWRLVV